ncbi:homocysteine-responsive endoplasmic reticulum-resident ubiquitin-like domain member 2 protein [Symsagittifera roscoffensis]|uniref:homocysteine-responsive endoplasmic reticulum-resident ubiquitin-like domain member 2 protein n=1 Tax=Symsagittifera roscoffensis TaxID=84072 RepID=UPI00307C5FE9
MSDNPISETAEASSSSLSCPKECNESKNGTEIQILLKTLTHGDSKLTCSSEISVKLLKAQISREFPSQPKIEDQKLIHAGILLKDNVILSDAFKLQMKLASSTERSKEFIVHLVCTAKGSPIFKRHQVNMSNASSGTASSSESTSNSARPSGTMRPTSMFNVADTTNLSTNGTGTANMANLPLSLDNSNIGFIVNYINSNITKEQYVEMVADMHEQHRKFYATVKEDVVKSFQTQTFKTATFADLNSTLNMLLGRGSRLEGSHSEGSNEQVTNQETVNESTAERENERNEAAQAMLEQRQRENAAVINAAGGFAPAQNDEVGEENDWLTWLYRESRLVVLLVILYSYSSLNRVLTVGVITALMYFFQRRWLPLFGRELMRRNDDNNHLNNDNDDELEPQENDENDDDGLNENRDNQNEYETMRDENPSEADNREGQDSGVSRSPSRSNLGSRNDRLQRAPPTRMARVYSAMETFVVAVTTFFVSLFPIELRQPQNI